MDDKEQFIAGLHPAAINVSKETGMSSELILAQAAQETGWGEKVLPGTNNIFNIKASPDWHGPTRTSTVPEFEHGKKVMVRAEFCVYSTVEEALQDRVKFLQENPRYAKAGLFDEGTKGNFEKEAAALQKAGYATDPKYAEQLIAVYNGPTMRRAIKHAQEQTSTHHHATVPRLDHAANPDHALYEKVLAGVHKAEAERHIAPGLHSERLAAALVVAAKSEGVTRIDGVLLSDSGDRAFVQQKGSIPGINDTYALVETKDAIHTTLAHSSAALAQVNQQQRDLALTKTQGVPQLEPTQLAAQGYPG